MNLFEAIEAEDLPKVELILGEGADPSQWDFDDYCTTPLSLAVAVGDIEIVRCLLDAGADINLGLKTPLGEAVEQGYYEIAILLLARGAAVDPLTEDGITPLMSAAARGDLRMVQLLLDYGADPQRQDREGHTALDQTSRDEIKQILVPQKSSSKG